MPNKVIRLIPGGAKPKPCPQCKVHKSFFLFLLESIAEFLARFKD